MRASIVQAPLMDMERAMGFLEENEERIFSGADLVVFPEKWITDRMDQDGPEMSSLLRFYGDMSARHRVLLCPGSLSVYRDGRLFNSSPLIDMGKLIGWQDKVSLFRSEKKSYTPGSEVKVFDTHLCRIGVCICYDVDFPYYCKMQAGMGARLILNPSLIDRDFRDMWHIYVRARSLENRLPFISVNSSSEMFGSGSMVTWMERAGKGVLLRELQAGDVFTLVELSTDVADLVDTRAEEDPGHYSLRTK
ncbi:hypothetical protein GCM10007108_01320 [Thermogymnomonas acidicola]|uniref:CN hydrolase domain-containing protein n=1 Tax=Thermogymnomonas acidicola TaxID=399579 RepID=A0AA37F981_9ARCH|nr:carbon-nitrogen hydrolase family protein [Thermogymnomonas acidicola]GGM66877.1 hypothetical protein GCM10007108_01320 [Thermogymnomonas acidicola]